MDTEKLKLWFEKGKRDFPWRREPAAYEVWISEVMLQQTLASVVVDYFERWMGEFPTVEALAAAPIERVIKVWEGLGYYSRARNLHSAAQHLVAYCGGKLPDTEEGLRKIPGIGPYTAGAILSFAYQKKAAAVDGNVIRVMTRYFKVEDDVGKPSTVNRLTEIVAKILPDEKPWVAMEALIELGATVCKKKPECVKCPVKEGCLGKEIADKLPYKEKKIAIMKLTRFAAIFMFNGEVLVRKGDSGKVMAGLYEFPYFDKKEEIPCLGLNAIQVSDLEIVKHSFTRFRVELFPSLWQVKEKRAIAGYEWVSLEMIGKLPFSSGHRRILKGLLNAHFTH